MTDTPPCRLCGNSINPGRYAIGYNHCLDCGDAVAAEARAGWCVVPMNKSNYMLVTDRAVLAQLNPKRTT